MTYWRERKQSLVKVAERVRSLGRKGRDDILGEKPFAVGVSDELGRADRLEDHCARRVGAGVREIDQTQTLPNGISAR